MSETRTPKPVDDGAPPLARPDLPFRLPRSLPLGTGIDVPIPESVCFPSPLGWLSVFLAGPYSRCNGCEGWIADWLDDGSVLYCWCSVGLGRMAIVLRAGFFLDWDWIDGDSPFEYGSLPLQRWRY